MVEKINTRLDYAISNLDNENFEELFPIILDDLEYILDDLRNDMDKLTDFEAFKYGTSFSEKTNSYFAKLTKVYFKIFYGFDINIINSEDYNLSIGAGGYNSNDGNIYYSNFGVMLSKQSELSFLHTCLHECRHKMQHSFYKSNELLSFPPYMLSLLKENLLEDSLTDNNREFYISNYNLLLTENDAEVFAIYEIYSFIKNLMHSYMKLCNKTEKEMNQLSIKIDKVKKIFNNILTKETFEINNDVVKKIHGDDLVDCNYKIGGQLVDRLIITDKYIKSKPELQSKYPLLKLLFNKNVPKSYDEIIFDKVKLMDGKSLVEQQKINDLYNEIIMSDPILSLTDKLEREGIHAAQEYLNLHPAIIDEYPLELEILNEKYGIFNNGIIKR